MKIQTVLLAVAIILISHASSAATCVPPTSDGAGLQHCLDNSSSGDTIVLVPGTYVPPSPLFFPAPAGRTFFIGKPLTIKGGGPGVILSGDLGNGDRALNVMLISSTPGTGQVKLHNLTIEGGSSAAGGFFVGGGIVAGDNQNIELKGVTLRDNSAFLGGALWLGEGSTWHIKNSHFNNNNALDSGGAIGTLGVSLLQIEGGSFDGNTASNDGGAIEFKSFGSLDIEGTAFSNNSAAEGGAMTIRGVSPANTYRIHKSEFRSNRAQEFGGALDVASIIGSGVISHSVFQYNTSDIGGGAIWFQHGRADVTNNKFVENSAEFGGAVGIQGDTNGVRSTRMILEGNQFDDNLSGLSGAAGTGAAVFAFHINNSANNESYLEMRKNHYNRNVSENEFGAVIISGAQRIVLEGEHYNFNWGADGAGALAIADIQSGSLNNLHFNHNDAGVAPRSFLLWTSPGLSLGKFKFSGKEVDQCEIDFVPGCP